MSRASKKSHNCEFLREISEKIFSKNFQLSKKNDVKVENMEAVMITNHWQG